MPAARPMLFSAPMIRALLDGRKTQTRRIVKRQPAYPDSFSDVVIEMADGAAKYFAPRASLPFKILVCPYGRPGDLLWVRESFQIPALMDPQYRATPGPRNGHWNPAIGPWKPSIHMPRLVSRLTLEITDVRAQRLHDISEDDARAEGCTGVTESGFRGAKTDFQDLWKAINGSESWSANPWVWALTFKVHQCNVDALLAQKAA